MVVLIAGTILHSSCPALRRRCDHRQTELRRQPSPPPVGAAVIPQIAWVDNNGQLHIGDLSGFTQRVVAQADADSTAPLVTAGGRVFWVRSQQPKL